MLEKLLGCSLITKLRSILLMETNLNATNKLIYGNRLLHMTRQHGLIPEDIYSEKNRLADDGTLAKIIFYDVVRQTQLPAGIAAVDADNCYDRIAHPIAFLVFQALGVPQPAAQSMLATIQNMKFFLRTGYGDSSAFACSTENIKTQGLCQGNGAAPAGWTVTSIAMINAHKRKGHGAHLICTLSNGSLHVVGLLFVDNTDLEHFDMRKVETATEAHQALKESINNWGKVLVATGGALKPSKCFYHLISFKWKSNGSWVSEDNSLNPTFGIVVPLEDGSDATIEHLPISSPTKTLGSMTTPTGCNKGAIGQMLEKDQTWIERVKSSKLHRRNIWFLLNVQFWPKVSFGIGTVTAPFEILAECLMKPYYQVLSVSGVRQSVRRELRQMDQDFFSIGYPHPGIECFIARSLQLQVRDRITPPGVHGTSNYRSGHLLSANERGLRQIWQPGYTLLAKIRLGKNPPF